MIGFMYNLKVHNKLNTKDFSTNILQIYVLMYEIIIDMSPLLSLTKYKLEFTSLTIWKLLNYPLSFMIHSKMFHLMCFYP
jgi:hypothetical protein